MVTSAQVVETSVNVTNNSPSRDYSHPDDQTTQTTNLHYHSDEGLKLETSVFCESFTVANLPFPPCG